jgi:hypothetical protein
MTRDRRLVPLAYALLGIVFFPLSEWLATAPFGTGVLRHCQLLYLIPVAVTLLGLPVFVLAMVFKSTRGTASRFLLFAVAGCAGAIGGMWLGGIVRMAGMRHFAQRSEAVVSAVRQYEQDHGAPPSDLSQLAPRYLAAPPTTGMGAYPEYRYHCGAEALERFHGNTWALSVFTPRGLINFDMMIYLPNQEYPDRGYGGVLVRVGSWAYVHE